MTAFDWTAMGLKITFLFLALLSVIPIMAWVERRGAALIQNRLGPNRLGPWGIFQSIADMIKFFWKEDPIPGHVIPFYYVLAPLLSFVPAIMTFAVIPFASSIQIGEHTLSFQIADLNVGILYVFAIASLGVYGIVIAGWASQNKYSMIGGLRSAAQIMSYEIYMGLSIVGLIMTFSTLKISEITQQQGNVFTHIGPWIIPEVLQIIPKWGIFIQPLGFIIFLISLFAETNRLPFDLPEGESEIIAGYHLEYGSMKFAMFMMAEYLNMTTASGLLASLYFGGWQLFPGMEFLLHKIQHILNLPQLFSECLRIAFEMTSFGIKLGFFMWFFVWVRWTLPRFRYDQLMDLGWKCLFPLSLLNILGTSIFIYYGWF